MLDSRALPMAINPQSGFIASANNKPTASLPVVGFTFSANDRILRLKELLSNAERIDMPFLAALQRDVKSNAALAISQVISAEAKSLDLSPQQQSVLDKIKNWNGEYEATSVGALAFELVFSDLVTTGFSRMLSAEVAAAHQQWSYAERNFEKDLTAIVETKRREILLAAIDSAGMTMTQYSSWGDIHRLSVGHVLSAIPVLGTFFVEADLPVSGSRETIMKTAHGAASTRHAAQYGSQSRHISDLSDPDGNFFVLLGGQDGWLGSANFADQLNLWQQGEYIQIPLRLGSIKQLFKHHIELEPS
jgi:penicillin amidase